MKRRTFLAKGTAASMLPFAFSPNHLLNMIKNSPYIEKIGLQLYTVRDQMAKDPEGTLKAIKEYGYYQVEAGDMEQLKTIKPMVDDLGLVVKSSFFPWPFLTGRWDIIEMAGGKRPPENYTIDHLIDDAAEMGLEYLVFGYLSPPERSKIDDYKNIIQKLNETGEKCNKAGVKLCYHNHSFEFGPIEGQVPYELLMEGFDPEMIRFELDVFWASIGGYDPVKLLKKISGKVRLLHLKDKLPGTKVEFNEREVPNEAFKELGNGEINIKKIIQIAEKVGVEYCMVEQDQSPDPIDSIGQSIGYLQKI